MGRKSLRKVGSAARDNAGATQSDVGEPVIFTFPVGGDGNNVSDSVGHDQNGEQHASTDVDDTATDTDGESDESSDSGGFVIDPADIQREHASGNGNGDGGDSGSGKRQRRKRGPNKRKRIDPEEKDALAGILFLSHMTASAVLHTPELKLTADETKQLADAINKARQYYDIPIVSPKTLAICNLAFVAAQIYGTRAVAIVKNAKEKKQGKGKVSGYVNGAGKEIRQPIPITQ